ncbi:MAG TPA: hypothetical protein PLJ08_23670 [Cyclobacteriaceae bacterium]|nr:hypothetical protein [Cyclobacteriaceae bacterium]
MAYPLSTGKILFSGTYILRTLRALSFLKAIKLGMILNGEGPLYESLLTIPVGNTIANKLIFSRACFPFRLTADRKEILNQNAPTIFGKLP